MIPLFVLSLYPCAGTSLYFFSHSEARPFGLWAVMEVVDRGWADMKTRAGAADALVVGLETAGSLLVFSLGLQVQ